MNQNIVGTDIEVSEISDSDLESVNGGGLLGAMWEGAKVGFEIAGPTGALVGAGVVGIFYSDEAR